MVRIGGKEEIIIDEKSLQAVLKRCDYLEQENRQMKSALEEIIEMFLNQVAWVGQLTNFEEKIYNKINEVLK